MAASAETEKGNVDDVVCIRETNFRPYKSVEVTRNRARQRRQKMELRCLEDSSTATNAREPSLKRSRPSCKNPKSCSSCEIRPGSSHLQRGMDYQSCDYTEGGGECIPINKNDSTFELQISPLQNEVVSSTTREDSGISICKAKLEEEEDSLTKPVPMKSPSAILNFGSSEESEDICSSILVQNVGGTSASDVEKGVEFLGSETDGALLASSQEESSVVNDMSQQVIPGEVDLQSIQSRAERIECCANDSTDMAPALSLLSFNGADSDSPNSITKCVSDSHYLPWGCASHCGRRSEMEDAMTIVPDFLSLPCSTVGGCAAQEPTNNNQNSSLHFFGVFDGHGGSQASNVCKDRLHKTFLEELREASSDEHLNDSNNWQAKWERAFTNSFNKVDVEVGEEVLARDGKANVGTTAVVAVVGACQIIVANCGDSRAVLSRGGNAIALSVDHKPEREDEMARIEAAGGKVICWNGYGYRVYGMLAMSRAIGDRYLKPYVISDPELTFTQRTEEDEFLILASDGLWDVFSNKEACDVVRRVFHHRSAKKLRASRSAQVAADYLSNLAVQQRNTSDNITVVVVDLRPRKRSAQKKTKPAVD
eukprot:TRINITY_DN12_c0_g1_i1.p1 TRINITY_DN12_c0_g1~~TRINITY_DN12_c0_g1_i1.p1  ORF type:complete len:595 (+),score=109.02 TRINITY_DN12_c0_g1_i1:1003-2787(+)